MKCDYFFNFKIHLDMTKRLLKNLHICGVLQFYYTHFFPNEIRAGRVTSTKLGLKKTNTYNIENIHKFYHCSPS